MIRRSEFPSYDVTTKWNIISRLKSFSLFSTKVPIHLICIWMRNLIFLLQLEIFFWALHESRACNNCLISSYRYLRHTSHIDQVLASLSTLMQFYDSRPPVLWSKWLLASSLLQAIKTCRLACPPGYLLHFS